MKLANLIADIRKMSDEELREHVRAIRHSKYVERPAQQARTAKANRKTERKTSSKFDKLLNGLSETDRANLINLLQKGQP